jgi:hypothetical protein
LAADARLPRRAFAAILAVGLLGACSARTLTETERDFAASVVGDAVDLDRVTVHRGAVSALVPTSVPVRPRTTCRERLYPPRAERVPGVFAAFVLGERMFFGHDVWAEDFTPDYPQRLDLRDAMRLAHELVHVWQWQGRRATGYSPFLAAFEHIEADDPYLLEFDGGRAFLDYGWEQQGILVEEFVCCRALDPTAPRTRDLHHLVDSVFPGALTESAVPRAGIAVPHPEIETAGICRQDPPDAVQPPSRASQAAFLR